MKKPAILLFLFLLLFQLPVFADTASTQPQASEHNFLLWIGAAVLCTGILLLMWYLDRDKER